MSDGIILENIEALPEKMEQIIIQSMFKMEPVRNALIPYLTPEIFQNSTAQRLYKKIDNYIEEYETFPTYSDVSLVITNNADLKEYFSKCFVDDISSYNQEHLLTNIEKYMKKSLYQNMLGNMISEAMAPDFNVVADSSVPEDLRNIFSFSFDNSVGMNLFTIEGMKRMIDFFHQASNYIETGIIGLDSMLNGGFHAKTLNLFMLPTNMGKSAIMCALASNMIQKGYNVLYVTLEMSEEMISQRIMANCFDIEQNLMKTFDETSLLKKFMSMQSLLEDKFRVKEFPTSTMNSNTIRRLAKEMKEKQGFEPDIIFIDYLELMKPNHQRKTSAKHEDLRTTAEELRDVGLEMDIPVVSAMQTNRDGYAAKELDLADMSGSFGVAMTADFVIAGVLTPENEIMKEYTWRCVKNRFGAKWQEFNVGIDFAKVQLTDLGNMPTINGELVAQEHQRKSSPVADLNKLDKINSIVETAKNNENTENFNDSVGTKSSIFTSTTKRKHVLGNVD